MRSPRTIVISDLHISAGELDDFDRTLEAIFCGFIGDLCGDEGPVELVINGDFLDFVQAPPWEGAALSSIAADGSGVNLSFTQEQSLAKLEAIGQQYGRVFEVLGAFVESSPAHVLTILPGNHDADIFWPEVRRSLSDRICGGDASADWVPQRVRFHLEQVYRPEAFPGIWIEHGHQYDPVNSFWVNGSPRWSQSSPPIIRDRNGQERLYECLGTRFLQRYLNRLDRDYPFVDNVKPFSRFLKIFGMTAFAPGFGPLRASAAVFRMLGFIMERSGRQPDDLLSLRTKASGMLGPATVLSDVFGRLSDGQQEAIGRALDEAGYDRELPLPMEVADTRRAGEVLKFLADHLELVDVLPEPPDTDVGLGFDLDVGDDDGLLGLQAGFEAKETAVLEAAASAAVADHGADAVIMGHTHEVVDRPTDLRYVNTGCWTRYYRFEDDEPMRDWALLKDPRRYDLFPFQLNYAEVTAGEKRAQVRLVRHAEKRS